MHRQIPLAIVDAAPKRLQNFTRGGNGLVVDIIAALADSDEVKQVYLWGPPQSGKSHLLVALHRQYLELSRRSFYVSLSDTTLTPVLLDSLDNYDLIAIDDVNCVAGHAEWERSLFNLINSVRDSGGKILFGASSAPTAANWALADLVSRFSWGPVLKLVALNENEIRDAMLASADQRGMRMDEEAADFLLKRYRRDVGSLLAAIETLDTESLAAGRERITIPFLKRCFVFD